MPDLRMPNLNQVVIAVRLTKDVEVIKTGTGTPMVNVSAVWSDGRKENERKLWINGIAFGKTAEMIGTLKKGAPLILDGMVYTDEYTDRDGGKRSSTKFVINRFHQLAWDTTGTKTDTPPQANTVSDADIEDLF